MSYFEIGIYQPKTEENIGTLWRSAYQLGAAGLFTIGKRYKKQGSDTYNTPKQIPLRHFETWDEFLKARPVDSILVGVEMGGEDLKTFKHPKQAIYLLGSEDSGLPKDILSQCQTLISLQAVNRLSYNVAVTGSIVMYHRTFLV